MKIEAFCNTSDEVLLSNVKINSARHLRWIKQEPENDKHAVIVGGGSSISDWVDEIRIRQQHGQTIFALNNAAKWLIEHGIVADYCVVVDAREINVGFVNHAHCDLLASQVSPLLFDRAKNAVLWHQEYPDILDRFDACLPNDAPEHSLIGGGTTVGLSAMVLAYAMGFRKLHLYGYDSSYKEDKLHAYSQDDPMRMVVDATAYGRTFKTTLAMAKQAELFPELASSLIDLGCSITIRGDGLLPWVSQKSSETITEQEKYQSMWEMDAYRNVAPGEMVASLFCLAANPKPSDWVIDFGAGTGRGALKIHETQGCKVLMLDFADNCLDEKVRGALNDKFRFAICDLTKPIPHKAKYGFCTDVMEHIEPEKVDDVLRNIMQSCDKAFFQISTVPDTMGALIGHPLHLTVEPSEWWREKFKSLGYAVQWEMVQETAVMFFVTQPLEEENA